MGRREMYALTISSEATNTSAEPVTLTEVKEHLRITSTAEDDLLTLYITAARQAAETITGRALINTQWELAIDSFASSAIELPRPPLSPKSTEVVITYTQTTGNTTQVNSTVYGVEYRAEPGFVRLEYESEWPTDVQDSIGAVRITYRSGYTTVETNDTPEAIKQWIKMRTGQMYEYREPLLVGGVMQNLKRDFVDGLLDPYRVISI